MCTYVRAPRRTAGQHLRRDLGKAGTASRSKVARHRPHRSCAVSSFLATTSRRLAWFITERCHRCRHDRCTKRCAPAHAHGEISASSSLPSKQIRHTSSSSSSTRGSSVGVVMVRGDAAASTGPSHGVHIMLVRQGPKLPEHRLSDDDCTGTPDLDLWKPPRCFAERILLPHATEEPRWSSASSLRSVGDLRRCDQMDAPAGHSESEDVAVQLADGPWRSSLK